MKQAIREHFEGQARGCDELGSPFNAALCRLIAERLDVSNAFGRQVIEWPGDPRGDNLSLRVCGALHALALSGADPALTAAYPPAPIEVERLWAAVQGAIAGHGNVLVGWLDSPPQTNEVARSAFILGGALIATGVTGRPLSLLELGSSAGLNLAFDEYRYELGEGRSWGDATAPVTIKSDWRGSPPPVDAPLKVLGRSGCDIRPLDPASLGDRARLMAYVWPDQTYRLTRLEAALKHAAALGRKPERADAGEWLERQLSGSAQAGVCRFVFHTIVRQYVPATTNARIDAALARAAAEATEDAPFAHLSVETDGHDPGAPMVLRIWPGERTLHLGRTDYHGRWVEWTAPK